MQLPYPIVAPSLLASNHAHLAEAAKNVETLGAQWLHIDIMDGHFVPNLSFGPDIVRFLRSETSLFFDVHLMVENPPLFIEPFAKAGANNISIHVEPSYPILDTLRHIRALGCTCGLALKPETKVDSLLEFLPYVDLVLVMTVEPGFGGQSFRQEVLPKIIQIHSWRQARKLNFRIEVDGGINSSTGQLCKDKGADTFVAGTAFFQADNPKLFIQSLQSKIH